MTFQRQPFLVGSKKFTTEKDVLPNLLSKMYTEIAFANNAREIALYEKAQIQTGQRWFNDEDPARRLPGFRRVYSIASAVAGDVQNIPHQIEGTFEITHLYGTAIISATEQIPLPYTSTAAVTDNVSLRISGDNIVVTLGASASSLSSGRLVLEYILTG